MECKISYNGMLIRLNLNSKKLAKIAHKPLFKSTLKFLNNSTTKTTQCKKYFTIKITINYLFTTRMVY